MSLRLAPPSVHPTSTTNTSTHKLSSNDQILLDRGAPSAPGLHDTLRSSSSSSNATATTSTHPLETRLAQWRDTQDALKHSLLARTYGIAEPIRRGMELKLVREGDWRPSVLGKAAGVHDDILSGRDCEVSWEDVYAEGPVVGGGVEGVGGFHDEMERKVGMGKW